MAEAVPPEYGEGAQIVSRREQRGFGRIVGFPQVERDGSAGSARLPEDSSADRNGPGKRMVTSPALALLAMEDATDHQTKPAPPADPGSVFAAPGSIERQIRSERHDSPVSFPTGRARTDQLSQLRGG